MVFHTVHLSICQRTLIGFGREIRTRPRGYEPRMLPLHYPEI